MPFQLGQDAAAHMDSPYFKQFACLNNWKVVTANDMRTFAAHLIVLGLVNKLELEEYWSRKTFTRTPFLVNLCLEIASRVFLAISMLQMTPKTHPSAGLDTIPSPNCSL